MANVKAVRPDELRVELLKHRLNNDPTVLRGLHRVMKLGVVPTESATAVVRCREARSSTNGKCHSGGEMP